MNTEEIEDLLMTSRRLAGNISLNFHRYLANEIDWRDRLVCIMGSRGTGKTTLLLQRLREAFGLASCKAVYVSLDDLWFSRYSVKDAITYLCSHGYTYVFMDEVHHLGTDWQLQVKNIYDQFPEINIVYSGSSMLKLDHARGDLSRRQAIYRLNGLSFREYLQFEGILDVPKISLEDLLKNHQEIASEICSKTKILPLFEKYLISGFYPFYKETHAQYQERLQAIIHTVLECDYPAIDEVSQETIRATKKMLMVLASSTPQTPNMSELYHQLDTERNQGLKMLNALERAGLLALVPGKSSTLKTLSKPEKIYCDNTNIMYAVSHQIDVGVLRETFFFNQMRMAHQVCFSGIGDFLVDEKYTFEVGGKRKGFGQIRNLPDSFVVNDGVEIGIGNKIPIWLFGLMY